MFSKIFLQESYLEFSFRSILKLIFFTVPKCDLFCNLSSWEFCGAPSSLNVKYPLYKDIEEDGPIFMARDGINLLQAGPAYCEYSKFNARSVTYVPEYFQSRMKQVMKNITLYFTKLT